ncbi:class I ribonucleotide reductase maintenance protein YfaE [Psychrobacter lutiphocae]|uniref:class I ribonucleotide reductase maintenance protein YfaE n=1 Tax=Psychrobacter lutiphocae TaxID=540500 RepID=UPI00036FF136|nr:class I ribonucleotide reductase maintenance protein YfaE [Psychrobacter lutiphocae]
MTWVITAKTRFYLHDGESLLDGLLRTGHDINYQCKEGYCGSCRVTLTAASYPVTYAKPPLAMIDDSEILPCCCQIQGVIRLKDVR